MKLLRMFLIVSAMGALGATVLTGCGDDDKKPPVKVDSGTDGGDEDAGDTDASVTADAGDDDGGL